MALSRRSDRKGHTLRAPRSPRWLHALALVFVLTPLLILPTAQAGQLHPQVADELSRLPAGEKTTVMFILEQQADIATLNQALKLSHATRQERHKRVVEALQKTARESQPSFVNALEARKVTGEVAGYTAHWITNMVVVNGTRTAIEDLAGRADVAFVEPNIKASLITPVGGIPASPENGGPPEGRGIGVTPGLRGVNAPRVWHELGINGTGALVANIDTGVDGNHPALAARWRGANGHPWQECWLDVLGTATTFPTDNGSHGTHTMGTITGLGATTQDTIGVAWGAQWIAANAINQGVSPDFDNDIIVCFQWMADPDHNPNTVDDVPDVVQNSWRVNEGFPGGYTDCDSRWWAAIDNCEAAGVCATFSAGNEGSGPYTIGSPADRSTTPLNCFSIGAIDASHYSWPFPIAWFSSRGPSGCPGNAIKPEVCGPGVDVYSSIPGGYYQAGWDGTSMAGPHIAGTVGLMRSANPDIDVDTIKQILMDTARDELPPGEDNDYGWGTIDAYEAVIRSLTGYGTLSGTVSNASNGGTPIAGAQVQVIELGRTLPVGANGHYTGMQPAGTYTVQASHPSFATVTEPGVVITAGQVTTQNFALQDIVGPEITDVTHPASAPTPLSTVRISATVSDFSAIGQVQLYYRRDGGPWLNLPMISLVQGHYTGAIPGVAVGTILDYYVRATDVVANVSLSPADAPNSFYSYRVLQAMFADDAETDQGWILSQPGDTPEGRWARWDPWGTTYSGYPCEPADDHTPAPGTLCFNTGVGPQGGMASQSDVDFGCVTLTSPRVNMLGAEEATYSYWRWYAQIGPFDAGFWSYVSNDDGATWVQLETLNDRYNSWTQVSFDLMSILPLTSQMRFRFVACDTGAETLVEAAIDDVSIIGVPRDPAAVAPLAPKPVTALFANRPNPFATETTLSFRLAAPGQVSLTVYEPSGRQVRTLVNGTLPAGEHSLAWNGQDDAGQRVAAGVYFYELKTEGTKAQRKMLMIQ
jgi:subtilisin family serine protease